jgi:hypothetical protein
MIFKWNGTGAFCIQPIDPAQPASKAILVKALIFTPGYNQVENDVWALCRLHCQNYIDMGKIEEIDSEFSALKTAKQLEIVAGCYNRKSLQLWFETTVKDEVRAAIQGALDSIDRGY